MSSITARVLGKSSWAEECAWGGIRLALRPLQALTGMPGALFLLALTAMLLRHPDVPFYEIDRVAFGLLVLGVAGQAVVKRQRLLTVERATWPMLGLSLMAVASVASQPFDNRTWCLVAAKFIVPFALFHLAPCRFAKNDGGGTSNCSR